MRSSYCLNLGSVSRPVSRHLRVIAPCGRASGSPRSEEPASDARRRPLRFGKPLERLSPTATRACATSSTRTAAARSASASRASHRPRALACNVTLWRRDGMPRCTRTHRPCRCAAGCTRRSGTDTHIPPLSATRSARTRRRPTRADARRAGSRSARRTRPSYAPTRILMTRSGSSASLDCSADPRARRPWRS